jgi:class 3 adenylate cyclase
MRCTKCGTEGQPHKRFCAECGSPLPIGCPKCGAENAAKSKFCADCGTPLACSAQSAVDQLRTATSIAREISIAPEQADATVAIDGERKTVTALFADIKGSMDLLENLDPEEARVIVDPALKLMIDAVHRYGGYIVQSTGDGIFALFGAPAAHEDHPQRALYTALRIQEEMRRYAARLREAGNLPIEARVGVNTGEVVVRSLATGDGHVEYTPIGHSTSLAARMQALAPTGSVATADATRRLCEGYFTFKPLGPARVKGVSEPVNVHEVTGLGALRTHFQLSLRRGLTKFVGRQHELEQMKRALELAKGSHGGVVAAAGDPGVGKSRLLYEFKALSAFDCKVLEAFSVSHGKASSYLPVIELLKDYFEIGPGDDDRKRLEKVNGKIVTLDRSLEDTLPYLFTLLSLDSGEDPLVQMDPQIRRRRTQEALKRILFRESLNQPLIVIFEDLHWIDAETQGLLDLLVDSLANARILLLVNYRPEYRHEWGNRTYYTQLRLDPLGRESAEEMLDALLTSPAPAALTASAGEGAELARLKRLIIERTEGNPFFIEEMVQALFEDGSLQRDGVVKLTRPLPQIRVPATVQAVLASRIDRLQPDEKDLLHMLAVLGRQFLLGLVQRVASAPADQLERLLSRLQVGEFIYEQPAFPEVEYIFKHALTQEVAYNSLLGERRKLLHERAGAAIEALYAGHLEDYIEELAHHYSRSDNKKKALQYLRMAADEAFKRSHHDEAITHSNLALRLLGSLPETSERSEAELALQLRLGQAFSATLGYGAPEVGKAFDRASQLTGLIENVDIRASVLGGLWSYHLVRANHGAAYGLAQQLWQLSAREGGARFVVDACYALGTSLFWMGEFAESDRIFQKGVSEYRPGQPLLNIAISDTMCWVLGNLAACLWPLGFPDKAMQARSRTLERMTSIKDPYTAAAAPINLAILRITRRDAGAEEDARQVVSISSEYGYTSTRLWGEAFYRCLRLQNGFIEEIPALLESMQGLRNMGARLCFPWFSSILADTHRRLNNPSEALTIINNSLAEIEQSCERQAEAELHRLKGENLLLQNSDASDDAEQCFRKAIDIARRQSAKSWELRAATSLARLQFRQGRRDDARTLLAEIYNWFTEGFDTADLKDAKALLDEIAMSAE